MAEGGQGRGRGGRGFIIAKLLEMEKRPGQPPEPPSGDGPPTVQTTADQAPPVQEEVPPPRPVIGGRGAMFQRMQAQAALEKGQQTPLQPAKTPVTSQPLPSVEQTAQPPMPGGRGRLMQMMSQGAQMAAVPEAKTHQPPASTERTASQPPSSIEKEVQSVTRRVRRMDIDFNKPPNVNLGTGGREVPATANYIPLYLQPGRGIFEYEVRFSPEVDDRGHRDKLLFVQHRELFGRCKTFDGVTLYLPYKLEEETVKLESIHPVTNETHFISLIFKRERSMGECIHMYNVLFCNIQRELNLTKLNREYFCQDLAHYIPQHKLEIWPGYVTAVDFFEGGIMLNCDTSHKVLRSQTVLDLMREIVDSRGGANWKETFQKLILGQSVMTRKPVNIYRIDDIDFNQNPTSSFMKSDNNPMTYLEYHRRKGIEIRDLKQPLLVHKPKPSKRPGGTGLLMLVPELCYLTGLTDEMRSDFKVMKDVANYTRINPNQRQLALQKFIDNIRASPNCVKLLDEWGLKVPEQTVKLNARVLNPEPLWFGRNYQDRGSENADWNRAATTQQMLEVVDIHNWVIIHTQRDERNAKEFVEMIIKVCPQLGVRIKYPDDIKIHDDRTDTYLKHLRERLNPNVQLAVIIFPSARDDRYSAIKKLCCYDRPIPSQVINSRTICKPDKLRSVVQKIALQINCKLGGALWAVKIPFKNAMICGMDTYHDTKSRAQCVAGFVASMNTAVTRWHSQVFMQSTDRELVDGARQAMSTALNKYYEVNNQHPDTVIVFRDGVGDGQLNVCKEHEVKALEKAFNTVSPDYKPQFAFIVCQKRINTRIFLPKGNNEFTNPPPGSVVDNTVTRRHLFDFFLVSQLVRQGTVTPTHYIVLHNDTKLDADKIQKLTYKMCHLYYNWPGTIRVPAPCQYAHKLAHLVGCSIHKEPAHILCDKLFFL